ncbi:MAG: alpha/beta hydrolase [Chloroflexi bacterium]|nr:MAG: alpha/beta hydrolase [Chloroflexota bacterium]
MLGAVIARHTAHVARHATYTPARMPKRLPRARTLKGDPKIAYYDSGGGVAGEPAVMLLHGSTMRSEDWENVFPRLATRYRVVAYDARGHGRSGRAVSYELRAFASDAIRVLREIVKGDATLIGHSLGALCALACAADAPELVRGLVLEDPGVRYPGRWEPEKERPLREALAETGDPKAFLRAVGKIPLGSPGPRGERTYGEMRGFYAAERVVTYLKDLDPAFVEWRLATDDLSAGEVAGWIAGVRSPALVIAGETRLGSQLDDNGEWALKKAIKDLTVKRFPGTGHVIHGYRPEPFLEALEPFLRRVRAPEGATGP